MGAVAIMYAAQAEQAKADQQRWEAERARLEAVARSRKLLRPKPEPNCVNCGAPKGPAVCEWCGTKHDAPPIGMIDLTTVYGIKGWR
jgi:hypothetical protein